jgi:hypothetical protein
VIGLIVFPFLGPVVTGADQDRLQKELAERQVGRVPASTAGVLQLTTFSSVDICSPGHRIFFYSKPV